MRAGFIKSCAALAALISGAASAQAMPESADGWQVRLGLAASHAPKYLGSGESRSRALPFVEAQFSDWLALSVVNGVEVRHAVQPGWIVGASLGIDLSERREKDGDRLKGLPEIKRAAAGRVFTQWRIANVLLGAEVRSRLGSEGRAGTTFDLSAAMRLPLRHDTALMIGANATAMDSRYARNFFAISSAEAAASGLATYEAGSGWRDAGVFAQVMHRVTPDWTVMARARSGRLIGDAKSSPIVEDRQQNSAFLAAMYTFK